MHVALVEFRYTTPYPIQLANAMGQLCHTTLILPYGASRFVHQLDQESVDLQFFHLPRYREPANLSMVWQLRRRLKAQRPDLLHITFRHWWGSPGLGLFSSYPVVATVHDVGPHPGDYSWWSNPRIAYPLSWRWADQVIVHSNADRQKLLSDHGCQPDRVQVIPIGPYDFYQVWARRDRQEKPNTVLFFGRIWAYKGLEVLIEAEPLITREVPGARIVIAGQGDSFDRYEQAMVNPDHFEVHNHYIPDEVVAELFQSASVVVLPYVEASQSGVISIASAFGKPVVATNVGGIPEVISHGQTGYLVPPSDPTALAEAVIALLRDPTTKQEMGRKALEKATGELSWQNIAKKTLHVYERAMAAS